MSRNIHHLVQDGRKKAFISHITTNLSSVAHTGIEKSTQSQKCPIKLVDVNKLLKSPRIVDEKMSSNTKNVHVLDRNDFEDKQVKKFTAPISLPYDLSYVTVSHVLSCFKEMLPSKFDLSRLIPNEKLSTLVIRYLKLDNDSSSQALMNAYLKIIIDASNAKESRYGDYTKHPYLNIEDSTLQAALAKVLPQDFSMVDVTNQILHCLCVVLNIGVYSDGYHFLRTQIRKFTSEGQQFNQIMNQGSDTETNSLSGSNSPSVPNANVENKQKIENDSHLPSSNCKKLKLKNYLESPKVPLSQEQISKSNSTIKLTTKVVSKKGHHRVSKSKEMITLEGILNYLQLKKCSARDILANFSLMFYLCRHLHIRSRQSNLQRLKTILNLIATKNIDMTNFKQYKTELDQMQKTPVKEFHQSELIKNDSKLRSKPVVVIENLTDFANGQMLFMREKSRSIVKDDDYFTSKQMSQSVQRYSSEHVRKLTNDSYKEFRKIIMKRDGVKVWFRLKFSRLASGTLVFVKDFRNSAQGWEKGKVKEIKGPFKYLVALDRGVEKMCFPDQIRPFPNRELSLTESRPQRPVKPKQLLNL